MLSALRTPRCRFSLWLLLAVGCLALSGSLLQAQRVRLPSTYGTPGAEVAPPTGWSSPLPPVEPMPSATLGGIQPFDPYALPTSPPTVPPGFGYTPPGGMPMTPAPSFEPPPALPGSPAWPAPGVNSPWMNAPAPTPYGAPYPGQAPAQPGSLFPNGFPTNTSGPPYQRLFQDTGFQYTWLAPTSNNSLQMHDVELSTSAFFPNFLRGRGPLRVTPGFAFHFLDGPAEPDITSDLPPRLYSAYLDFGWEPEFTPQFGAEVNFRTGIYTDFDTVTWDSLRFMGSGVGVIRVTPTTALKLGVAYIDRQDLKLLPAAGILWQPNAQTRWDIFFPNPKLASYLRTVGNSQVWWYLGGEYGGGSWTMKREQDPQVDASEKIDINDIRVYVGLEWNNLNRWYGFIEAGYVFEREIYYTVVPTDTVSLDSTIMLRAGLSF